MAKAAAYRAVQNILPNVSRETMGLFEIYHDNLTKWQATINLISRETLDDIWNRHILDCLQLVSHLKSLGIERDIEIADIGSGAGLPGVILAIAGYKMDLIEPDYKKVAFLNQMRLLLGVDYKVIDQKVEQVTKKYRVITSRALAKIVNILALTRNIRVQDTQYLLLKGASYEQELQEAKKSYGFEYEIYNSITEDKAQIVRLHSVREL